MNEVLITIMLTCATGVMLIGSVTAMVFLCVLLRDFVCEEIL